ncbi:PREDICTED: nucleolar and coiled-body phosphoprotein 1-like [Erythranthe guttata]|uniref:nucleolar and coiled-body phosphoprotein 1-like n=1 Tax=Erythranthe guttata TaxID=4155 RepID=UPI00064D78E9|nr:PREDICTED: nucleolar and coiled-body phosphoprotein 1-like [Erythranthe guttata]|eukprot:XP_012852510.1 PREDICTED: nucleolar and coiled-body phosphoprotein 1-like [Erythranthe guttata]
MNTGTTKLDEIVSMEKHYKHEGLGFKKQVKPVKKKEIVFVKEKGANRKDCRKSTVTTPDSRRRAEDEVDDLIAEREEDTSTTESPDTNSPILREEGVEPSVTTSDSTHPTETELQPIFDVCRKEPSTVPISYIEPGDELNPIDPDNFDFVGPSSTAGRFPTRRSKRTNPFPDLNTAVPQRRRGENSPRRGSRGGRRGSRGGRTPVQSNPRRGLHLVDEETDDEAGDPTFAAPQAQALSSSSSESSSNNSPSPASTQGETSQPSMATAASQHSVPEGVAAPVSEGVAAPVSEGVAAHAPEDAAAPTVSANVPQNAAEDAAPYQDEEMPDFSGMSSAEHVDIPSVDAQDFTTTEETPSAPHGDPLETLAEAAVQADASPPQAEDPEKSDDSWEVPLTVFRKNLPSSDSDSESSEDSSQQEEGVAPRAASPEPAYVPDELEDSEDDDSSEEEEPDLDGKNLSTPFEVTNAFSPNFYFESDSLLSPQVMNCHFIEEKKISKEEFDRHRITAFLHQRKILNLVEIACSYDPLVVKEFYANLQTSFLKKNSPNFGKVFVRNAIYSFSPKIINSHLQTPTVIDEDNYGDFTEICKVISGNRLKNWPAHPRKFQVSQLTAFYSVLFRLTVTNWIPSKNVSVVTKPHAVLMYKLGMGLPVDFGKLFFDTIGHLAQKISPSTHLPYPSLIYSILLSQKLGQDDSEYLHTPQGQNNIGTKGVAPHVDNTSNLLVSVPRDLLLQQLTHSLAQITYHQSMVEMIQKALSDQKGGEKDHETEAGTSHPLDARGREQRVNEEEAKKEGEAQEESSGSSDGGGAAAETEETLETLDILL